MDFFFLCFCSFFLLFLLFVFGVSVARRFSGQPLWSEARGFGFLLWISLSCACCQKNGEGLFIELKSAQHLTFLNFKTTRSACSVAASYKPPMLVTRVRLLACAVNLLLVFSKSAHLALAVQVPRSSPFLFAPTPHDPTLLGGCWLLLQLLGMRSANEPPVGIEPTTIRLRSACSAS